MEFQPMEGLDRSWIANHLRKNTYKIEIEEIFIFCRNPVPRHAA
jgi:hypothetical protein